MTTYAEPPGAALVAGPGGSTPLARCVGDVETFAREVWGSRPLVRRAAAGAGFHDLLSPADVDELLGSRALRLPFFTLVQDGAAIPTTRYTRSVNAGNRRISDLPDSAKVAALHGSGATVVLQALHRVHPPLGEFCRGLAEQLGHQTQVNAYITPPGAQGFAAHHDTHDVLVLQVDGTKRWTIREPLVVLPLPAQPSSALDPAAAAASPVHAEVELRAGDVLYLPRGWLHEAATTDERSVHLTVGLLHTTWHDVLADAVDTLAVTALPLRAALPLPVGSRPRSPAESPAGSPAGSAAGLASGDAGALALAEVESFRAAALAWLREVPSQDLARLVAGRRERATPPEPVAPLAQDRAARALTPATPVRPRRGLTWRFSEDGDRTVLTVGGTTLGVPSAVGDALRRALAGPTTPGTLGLDEADGLVLVRRLLREGLLLPDANPASAGPAR